MTARRGPFGIGQRVRTASGLTGLVAGVATWWGSRIADDASPLGTMRRGYVLDLDSVHRGNVGGNPAGPFVSCLLVLDDGLEVDGPAADAVASAPEALREPTCWTCGHEPDQHAPHVAPAYRAACGAGCDCAVYVPRSRSAPELAS